MSELASGYDVDRRAFTIGCGSELFERSRAALLAWRHLAIPWLEICGATRPAATGQVVATLVRVSGLWLLSPCRVIYVEPGETGEDHVAFAYGTLTGHVERGEERFSLRLDATTGEVIYEILAFSRPAIWLTRLGYPLARALQRRFAYASADALARVCGGTSRRVSSSDLLARSSLG